MYHNISFCPMAKKIIIKNIENEFLEGRRLIKFVYNIINPFKMIINWEK